MLPARNQAVPSIERFFQFSLLGLVTCAFCALADTGRLDLPSLLFLLGGVVWRGLMVVDLVRLRIPQHLITILATAYLVFYPIDFYFISHDFFAATAHGVCFLGVARILSARSNRDYLYTGSLAFVALIGAAALSTQIRFFGWLALAIVFALGALTSAEIRRGFQRNARAIAPAGIRTGWRTGWALVLLVSGSALGILGLTAGLFFVVPRTAHAAAMLFPNSPRLTGFTNSIDLGRFGPIAKDNRPVLHIRAVGAKLPPNLKWRGTALSDFNGRNWTEPPLPAEVLGRLSPGDIRQRSRRDGDQMLYRVDVLSSDTGTLFIAGIPEFINLAPNTTDSLSLVRTAEDSYRALPALGEPLGYEVSTQRSSPPTYPLPNADRVRNLNLPRRLDRRIAALGLEWSGTDSDSSDMVRANRIQEHLRREFTYSLDTGEESARRDPLADFLFVTKRGYCEYFASAMAVLLRTQGIPARVATGFQSGYYNDISGSWVVRASDAHAWVEAWISGRGWVTFDPTPPDTALQAGGWLEARLRRLNMYLDAIDTEWQQWVMAYNPGQQAALLRAAGGGGMDFSWPEAMWHEGETPGLVVLAVILTVVLFRMFGARWYRGWMARMQARKLVKKIRSGAGTPHDARLLYERMLESMARRGFQKPAWFTPMEFARNLPPGERDRVGKFTAAYNEVRFGGYHRDADGAARLTQMLESLEAGEAAR